MSKKTPTNDKQEYNKTNKKDDVAIPQSESGDNKRLESSGNDQQNKPAANPSSNHSATATQSDSTSAGRVIGVMLMIGIITLVIWALLSMGNGNNSTEYGRLDGATSVRLGNTETVTLSEEYLKDSPKGTNIEWYVDDVKVNQSTYDGKGSVSYQYAPTAVGRHSVRVKVGNSYTTPLSINGAKPLLTITVPDVTINYGEQLPAIKYEYSGLRDGDTWDSIQYNGNATVDETHNQVGVYPLQLSNTMFYNAKYDFEYNCGNLIVLPRTLIVTNRFEKTYDGSSCVDVGGAIVLDGIVGEDHVIAKCDSLYYCDKTVGEDKPISVGNIRLEGKDAHNYVLSSDNLVGKITPKQLTLVGTIVNSKLYDGTSKATINNNGRLEGVVDGDIVVIGQLNASFEDAKLGKTKRVKISDITLVGADKCNYSIENSYASAHIVKRYMDLVINKTDVIQGDTNN